MLPTVTWPGRPRSTSSTATWWSPSARMSGRHTGDFVVWTEDERHRARLRPDREDLLRPARALPADRERSGRRALGRPRRPGHGHAARLDPADSGVPDQVQQGDQEGTTGPRQVDRLAGRECHHAMPSGVTRQKGCPTGSGGRWACRTRPTCPPRTSISATSRSSRDVGVQPCGESPEAVERDAV